MALRVAPLRVAGAGTGGVQVCDMVGSPSLGAGFTRPGPLTSLPGSNGYITSKNRISGCPNRDSGGALLAVCSLVAWLLLAGGSAPPGQRGGRSVDANGDD